MATDGPPPPTPTPLAAGTFVLPDPITVAMQAADARPPGDRGPMPLWIAIRNRRTDFTAYSEFITAAFGSDRGQPPEMPALANQLKGVMQRLRTDRREDAADCLTSGWLGHGLHAYELLKSATEIFLLLECGVFISSYGAGGSVPGAEATRIEGHLSLGQLQDALTNYLADHLGHQRLPYIRKVLDQTLPTIQPSLAPFGEGFLRGRVDCPCFLELIWSYWHEEGMLVQGLNALSLRFQNRRISDRNDPLANLELSPLRPLGPVFWGYVQDEQHRLSLMRRSCEYEHEYGIALLGKAVPSTMRVADRRSKFIEAFHDLLFRCAQYYQQSANLQFNPDPFPLLNGLKEVHLALSQGAGNQFGDLPWTARVEMLMQQWILARPEIRDFLGRRPMVVYPEAWMANAEALKTLMGWTDTPITHFRNLGVYGEQLLLSIRWHDWGSEVDSMTARDWANYFRPEIQGYLHAYRVATGVDMTAEPRDAAAAADRKDNPAALLARRLDEQRRAKGAG